MELVEQRNTEPEPEPEPEPEDRELTKAPPPSYQAAAHLPSVAEELPPPYPGPPPTGASNGTKSAGADLPSAPPSNFAYPGVMDPAYPPPTFPTYPGPGAVDTVPYPGPGAVNTAPYPPASFPYPPGP